MLLPGTIQYGLHPCLLKSISETERWVMYYILCVTNMFIHNSKHSNCLKRWLMVVFWLVAALSTWQHDQPDVIFPCAIYCLYQRVYSGWIGVPSSLTLNIRQKCDTIRQYITNDKRVWGFLTRTHPASTALLPAHDLHIIMYCSDGRLPAPSSSYLHLHYSRSVVKYDYPHSSRIIFARYPYFIVQI